MRGYVLPFDQSEIVAVDTPTISANRAAVISRCFMRRLMLRPIIALPSDDAILFTFFYVLSFVMFKF